MVRRDRVVGIGHGDEIRHGLPPDVFRGRGPAARGREEVRLCGLSLVEHDLAGRRIHGGVRRRLLVLEPEVHLAARVRIEVECPGPARGQCVRARDHGLCLQRLRMPRERHLRRDDAVQVLLEADHVDRPEFSVDDVDLDRAAIEMLQLQRRRAGLEEQGPRQRPCGRLPVDLQLQRRCQGVASGGDVVHGAGGVAHAKVGGRPEGERRHSARQQHAYLGDGRGAELRAGEIVQDDLCVTDTFLRVAVGAVLAHADAVTPAVSRDHERRRPRGGGRLLHACRGRRTGAEQEDGGDCERSTHRAGPSEDSDEASKAAHVQRPSLRNADLIVWTSMYGANSCRRLWG